MIDTTSDQVMFSFPDVHPDAKLVISFQRTLRMPRGEREMPRLPSLGRFPVYTVDEHAQRIPRHWLDSGGAMLPMYQSEAMWLSFQPSYSLAHRAFYPFAVKIRAGGLNAIQGARWTEGMHRWPQDYLVISDHSWLGGFHTGANGLRQFVAMPLGSGYLPDDGVKGPNRFGRLELVVYPMRVETFTVRYPRDAWQRGLPGVEDESPSPEVIAAQAIAAPDALQRQALEEGLFPLRDWDQEVSDRYTLHLVNSLHWCAITGGPPPMAPRRLHPEPEGQRASTVAAPGWPASEVTQTVPRLDS